MKKPIRNLPKIQQNIPNYNKKEFNKPIESQNKNHNKEIEQPPYTMVQTLASRLIHIHESQTSI